MAGEHGLDFFHHPGRLGFYLVLGENAFRLGLAAPGEIERVKMIRNGTIAHVFEGDLASGLRLVQLGTYRLKGLAFQPESPP